MIPYGRQTISTQDKQAVLEVLDSLFLTQGNKVPEFEQALCQKVGAQYGIAVCNASAALHLACLSLGLSEGDYGWTVPLTFVATANAIHHCGAKVDFIDIDSDTGSISLEALDIKLEHAKKKGILPKVLIIVHYAGISCDMAAIQALCQPYGIRIIEDAAHALGGSYHEQAVGSCQYSDCTVFSFHPVKSITSAEGGMVVTHQQDIAEQLQLLRSHGIDKDPQQLIQEPWQYNQQILGYNYRLSDLQAALGLSQLKQLDAFIRSREQQATYYRNHLSQLPIQLLSYPADRVSAHHLFVIRLLPEAPLSRQDLLLELRQQQIITQVHYIPVHTQPYYQQFGFRQGDYPAAEYFYEHCLSLPIYPELSRIQQQHIIDQLTSLLLG